MKQLIVLVPILFFFACKKNDSDNPQPGPYPIVDPVSSATRTALMAKIWVFDSSRTDQPGSSTMIQTDPKIELNFSIDTYYAFIPGASPQHIEYSYELEEPARVYHWIPANGKDTSQYFTITSLTEKSLVFYSLAENDRFFEYYHAK